MFRIIIGPAKLLGNAVARSTPPFDSSSVKPSIMTAGNVTSFLFLLGISAFCWAMVFSSSSRRKFDKPTYNFWRLNAQERQDWSALSLAGYLVGGLFFSLLTLVYTIVGIYRLAAR